MSDRIQELREEADAHESSCGVFRPDGRSICSCRRRLMLEALDSWEKAKKEGADARGERDAYMKSYDERTEELVEQRRMTADALAARDEVEADLALLQRRWNEITGPAWLLVEEAEAVHANRHVGLPRVEAGVEAVGRDLSTCVNLWCRQVHQLRAALTQENPE